MPVSLGIFDEAGIAMRGLDWAQMIAMLLAKKAVLQPKTQVVAQPPRQSARPVQSMHSAAQGTGSRRQLTGCPFPELVSSRQSLHHPTT